MFRTKSYDRCVRVKLGFIFLVMGTLLSGCSWRITNNPQLANPASVYCGQQGGTLQIKNDATGGEFGVCNFSDGSNCEEWQYYRKECLMGNLILVSKVNYDCSGSKKIEASYFEGPTIKVKAGEPPKPSGKVSIVLSDGRTMTLPQTISGSGIRYANEDESLVFWSKGEGAFITEKDRETYSNCVTTK